MVAVMINTANPTLESSHVMIWAAMNLLPKVLGVIILTGVLSAGISSATTFLSLIGASVANDCIKADNKHSIAIGRVVMVMTSGIVLMVALLNPPSIFWIMFLGGAIASSSWMPVALASIFSKRVTKTGAFCGMLFGFLGCFALRLYSALAGVTLPVYLDPSIVGIVCNVIAMYIGSKLTKVTEEEETARQALFVIPEEEKNPIEVKKTLNWSKFSVGIGVIVTVGLIVFWVVPYLMYK